MLKNICLQIHQILVSLSFCVVVLLDLFITDQCAMDLMKAAADCRRLFGGPLNPSFDVCKTIHDSLFKVGNLSKIFMSIFTATNLILILTFCL